MTTSRVSLQDQVKALLTRVSEPILIPKTDKKIHFSLPKIYYEKQPESYIAFASKTPRSLRKNNNVNLVELSRDVLEDLRSCLTIPRTVVFSVFLPKHQELAARLIEIFLNLSTVDEFISAAAYCRDYANVSFFVYTFSVALMHRKDARNVDLPLLYDTVPEKFIIGGVLPQTREQFFNVALKESTEPIELKQLTTGTNVDREHQLWYFREDILVNLHHWHWHLINPIGGPMEVVNKDRRGELFYYMHQQIVARYNFERLCHGMMRVKSLTDFKEPMKEGYFAKLTTENSSVLYPGRDSETILRNMKRLDPNGTLILNILDLEMWRDRIMKAINAGNHGVIETNKGIKEELTIDKLGNMVEASNLSPNKQLYGNLHNSGHNAISSCHDPEYKFKEDLGVMSDTATAMRDPIFYRWHSFINDVFVAHKDRLDPYTTDELKFEGITIERVDLRSKDITDERNTLHTFWQEKTIPINNGFNFLSNSVEDGNNDSSDVKVNLKVKQLQHQPFTYTIKVSNTTGKDLKGTVRIFLAPKFDELENPWTMSEQKYMMIELERKVVSLPSSTTHTIEIESVDSNLTFRDPLSSGPGDNDNDPGNKSAFCWCGWPQNMLVPKGNLAGMQCQLFIMISDYQFDEVEQSNLQTDVCSVSAPFCGLRDQKYPDKRDMGYPFDRRPLLSEPKDNGSKQIPDNLAGFAKRATNMYITDVVINFTDEIRTAW